MSSYLTTLFIAFCFFILAIALICISRIITGKMNVRIGRCGRVPSQKRDEKCGKDKTCPICQKDREDDV